MGTKWSAITGKLIPEVADQTVIIDSDDSTNKLIELGNIPLTGNIELKALATGLLKNTTTTGTPSIAGADVDYVTPVTGVYTVGKTTGCATLSDAITTIGSTPATLVVPSGNHIPPADIPANIHLRFVNGGYLDTTSFLSGAVEDLTPYSTTDITVTMTGHGRVTGDHVVLSGITQASWSVLNHLPYTITKLNDNSFRLNCTLNASGYIAYDPITDGGVITQFVKIAATVEDTFNKIFEVNSDAITFAGAYGGNDRQGRYIRTVRPEWWGAVGDYNYAIGGTDNLIPFNRMTQSLYLVGYHAAKGVFQLDDAYYLSSTWSIWNRPTADGSLVIKGTGSISSDIVGYPVIELVSVLNVSIKDGFRISGIGSGANCPSVGIWMGRSTGNSAGSGITIDAIFSGTFQYGYIFNANAEVNRIKFKANDGALTQAASFGYAGVMNPEYYPGIVPKCTTYTQAAAIGRADSNTWNTLDIEMGPASEGVGGCCVLLENADVNIEKLYYGASITTGYLYRLIGNANLEIKTPHVVEGESKTGVFSLTSSIASNCKIYAPGVGGFGSFSGLFIESDVNTNLRYSNLSASGSVTLLGGLETSIFSIAAGDLNLNCVTVNNTITIASAVTSVRLASSETNFNYKTNNTVYDRRINNVTGTGITKFDDKKLTLGLYTNTDGVYDGHIELAGGGACSIKIVSSQNCPTSGTWNQGDLVLNASRNGTVLSTMGWYCRSRGTFGTITATPTCSNLNGTTSVVVNSTTYLKEGHYISISGGMALGVKILKINTTTKTLTLDDVTGSGAGPYNISFFGPPTFGALPSIGMGISSKGAGDSPFTLGYNYDRTYLATGAVTFNLPTGDLSAYVSTKYPAIEFTFIKTAAGTLTINPGAGNFINGDAAGVTYTNAEPSETNHSITLRLVSSATSVNKWAIISKHGTWSAPTAVSLLGAAKAGVADGTTVGKCKTTNAIYFKSAGVVTALGATDDFWTLTGVTTSAVQYRKVGLCIDSTGAAQFVVGTVAASQAAALLPAIPSNYLILGWVEIPNSYTDGDDLSACVFYDN